jgi:hypothetical protein
MKGILPSFLKFNTASDLIRIGRDFDGGYLISKSDLNASECLIGMGINDDWSFESEFLKNKEIPLLAYDASISKTIFFKKIVKSIFRIDNPRLLLHWIRVYFAYKKFFVGNRQHIEKFVGLNASGAHCTMDEILSKTDSGKLFLKIDIDCSEYRILETLIKNKERICGIAIEFHDCDTRLNEIKHFVENIGLKLIHVHANNWAPIRIEDSLPTVLELTFSKHANIENESFLPHKYDMPCNELSNEIKLEFAK